MSPCSPAGVLGMSPSTESSFLRSARSPAAGPEMPDRIPRNPRQNPSTLLVLAGY